MRKTWIGFILLAIFVSCHSKSNVSRQKEGCQYGSVVQDFKTDVAWIVMEWNCKPGGWGSGFLIDRARGVFYTNKHVVNEFDSYGKGSHKIYFNGKFYNAEVVKVPPLRDAAMIRITDVFDPKEFPEPVSFATEKVKKGDKVFVEGFHPHPYLIIESNKTEDYNERIIPIWDTYYNLGTHNLDKKREIVFEQISATVVELNAPAHFGDTDDAIDRTKELSNTYTMAKADKDHKFSFGGLSGTVMRNIKGEIVGIFTLGPQEEFEKGEKIGGVQLMKRVYKTFGLTPIESVKDLRQYIDKK